MINDETIKIDQFLYEKVIQSQDMKSEIQSNYSLTASQMMAVKKKYFSGVLYHTYLENQPNFSMEEVESLIFFDRVSGELPFSDYQKLFRKIKTLFYIEKESSDSAKSLSVQLIQKLYFLLYWEEEILEDGTIAFPYRDSVALIDDDFFTFSLSPVSEIPFLLERLVSDYMKRDKQVSPLLLASQFQYRFLEISPFRKGNEELSYFLFNLLIMFEGFPAMILDTSRKAKHRLALKEVDKDQFYSLYDVVLENSIFSMEYFIKLLKQSKNKTQISPATYFSSVIKDIQNTEKEVMQFMIQKEVDEKAVRDVLTAIERAVDHYFMENHFAEIITSRKKGRLKEMMHAHLLQGYFVKQAIRPLWETKKGSEKNTVIYNDSVDSLLTIKLISKHLYIPNSIIYFGVVPTKRGNFIFSIQISTYLDFKKEERFPNSLSFFHCQKGGISLKDWKEEVIADFLDVSMKDFFDQLIEKVIERKRILKSAL